MREFLKMWCPRFRSGWWGSSEQWAVNTWTFLCASHCSLLCCCRGFVNCGIVLLDGIVLCDVAGQGAVNIWCCLSVWSIHCNHCWPSCCMARHRPHVDTHDNHFLVKTKMFRFLTFQDLAPSSCIPGLNSGQLFRFNQHIDTEVATARIWPN